MFTRLIILLMCITIQICSLPIKAQVVGGLNSSENNTSLPEIPFFGEGDFKLAERFALVLGIDNYSGSSKINLKRLNYAAKDASDVASVLSRSGFRVSSITTSPDRPFVNRNDILNGLAALDFMVRDSARRTGRPPIALVYFAGHGINFDGLDYVLPSDFAPNSAEDVSEMAIGIDNLKNRVSWSSPALKILIFDACRTPLLGMLKRSSNEQLVKITPGHVGRSGFSNNLGKGNNDSFIMYSTARGQAAFEDEERNGRFTRALVETLERKAAVSISSNNSEMSDLASIFQTLRQQMQIDNSDVAQLPAAEQEASRFVVYPSRRNFDAEARDWDGLRTLVPNLSPGLSMSQITDYVRGYEFCNLRSFLLTHSFYSYYSFAAVRRMEEISGGKPFRCDGNFALRTSHNEAGYPADDGLDRPEDPSPKVKVKNVRLTSELPDIRGFDPEIELSSLRISSANVMLRAHSRKAAPILGNVRRDEIIALVSESSDGFARVRTSEGHDGYVDASYVSSGRSVMRFDVRVDISKADVPTIGSLNAILKDSLVTDILIQLAASDGPRVFGAAREIARLATEKVRSSYDSSVEFLPRIQVLNEPDSRRADILRDEIRITVAFIPISQALRSSVAFFAGSYVNALSALDLATVAAAISRDPARMAALDVVPRELTASFQRDRESSGVVMNPWRSMACLGALSGVNGDNRTARISRGSGASGFNEVRTLTRMSGFSSNFSAPTDVSIRDSRIMHCSSKDARRNAEDLARLFEVCNVGKFAIMEKKCSGKNTNNFEIDVFVAKKSE